MVKNNLKAILLEIKETTQIMIDNIDDVSVLRFFSGKLAILSKQVVACFSENN